MLSTQNQKFSQWDHLWVYCIYLLNFVDMAWVFFQMRKKHLFPFSKEKKTPNNITLGLQEILFVMPSLKVWKYNNMCFTIE